MLNISLSHQPVFVRQYYDGSGRKNVTRKCDRWTDTTNWRNNLNATGSILGGVAYRMLGSLTEADDAVQEAWLRLSPSDTSGVENLGGWLTTIVARVCLDMLRSRKSRKEEPLDAPSPEPVSSPSRNTSTNPEHEALLAESVGLALLVVLETLAPAERLAFVLHDIFDMTFEEIASIVGRTPTAARQLASRGRRRVRGNSTVPEADLNEQRHVVDAFLAALRGGDFEGLLTVLDPDLVVHADNIASATGATAEVRGAANWAKGAIAFARGARFTQPALINGAVGLVVAPRGRLFRVLTFKFKNGKIAGIEVVGDPATLSQQDLAVLGD
jgi:RNA polymerase sigma factor (sigma-70 family)